MMQHSLFALSLGFAGVILASQPGVAQGGQCAPRDDVIAYLSEKYGETRRSIGLAGQGAVMEMHAADATGTWTITMTLPDGVTCMIASGQGYETLTEELPAAGDPA
jgi:hypothetical protein